MATRIPFYEELDVAGRYIDLLSAVVFQAHLDIGNVEGRQPLLLEKGDELDARIFLVWCKRCLI